MERKHGSCGPRGWTLTWGFGPRQGEFQALLTAAQGVRIFLVSQYQFTPQR